MLLTFAFTVQACAVSKPSGSVGVDLPALPPKLVSVSCSPVTLPDRDLTRAEVEKLWARDRARLSACGYSLGGLIAFYTELRGNLAANK